MSIILGVVCSQSATTMVIEACYDNTEEWTHYGGISHSPTKLRLARDVQLIPNENSCVIQRNCHPVKTFAPP